MPSRVDSSSLSMVNVRRVISLGRPGAVSRIDPCTPAMSSFPAPFRRRREPFRSSAKLNMRVSMFPASASRSVISPLAFIVKRRICTVMSLRPPGKRDGRAKFPARESVKADRSSFEILRLTPAIFMEPNSN